MAVPRRLLPVLAVAALAAGCLGLADDAPETATSGAEVLV